MKTIYFVIIMLLSTNILASDLTGIYIGTVGNSGAECEVIVSETDSGLKVEYSTEENIPGLQIKPESDSITFDHSDLVETIIMDEYEHYHYQKNELITIKRYKADRLHLLTINEELRSMTISYVNSRKKRFGDGLDGGATFFKVNGRKYRLQTSASYACWRLIRK